jgi:hypothetical protein
LKPRPPNQVKVLLADLTAHLTDAGDHDIQVDDGGRLTVMEYSEPRNTGGIVAVFPRGEWIAAFFENQTDRPI